MAVPPLVMNATKAMAIVCRFCDNALAAHYSAIYAQFLPQLKSLPVPERGSIIEGLARLIGKLPLDQAYQALQELLFPINSELCSLLDTKNPDTYDTILALLNLLCSLCASCKCKVEGNYSWDALFLGKEETPHPLIKAMAPVWPQLVRIQEFFSSSFEISDVLLRITKNTVLSTGPHMVVALQIFCLINLRSLQQNKHQTFIAAASILINPFTNAELTENPCVSKKFSEFLGNVTSVFLECIKSGVDALFVKGYYATLFKVYSRAPCVLFQSPVLNDSIKVALHFVPLTTHIGSLKDILKYIECFFEPNKHFPDFSAKLAKDLGPVFIKLFLSGVATNMTKAAVTSTGNVLWTLKKYFPEEVRVWMRAALQEFNCPCVDEQAKLKFLNTVGEHKSKKDFTVVILEFFHLCRGWNSDIISLV